jgi:hypothetical protein
MKALTLTVTQHGSRCVSVAVVSDEEKGGSAVPAFGKDALRLALLYLEELSSATITGELEHVQMMNEGRTFDELRAARATGGVK